jgi:hypothetical protein
MDRATHLREWEEKLLHDALAALARTTGLNATILAKEPRTRAGVRPDATIEIKGEGKRFRFPVEIKAVDRAVALTTAKQQLEPFDRQGVLVAPYLTAELANHCREKLDLQFIDTWGNAYLRAPGLYVLIRGERPRGPVATAIGTRGGGTATALRVVFALLCERRLLNAPYREIVAAAGVALGAVGWVLYDLRQRGFVTGAKRALNRRWLEPGRLLDEWVTNYPIKLRPKLNQRRFRAPDPGFWQQTQLADGALWGGEVAGHKLTGHLKPANCTIYIDPAAGREGITRVVQRHRLRADPEGDVEILDKFWNFPAGERPDLVPPLLIYADLVATLDPRNLQIAKQIRNEYIEHVPRPA